MSGLKENFDDLVDNFSGHKSELNDNQSNRTNCENLIDKISKVTEPIDNQAKSDIIVQRLMDKPEDETIKRFSVNESDNQANYMIERSDDNLSDKLRDRFDLKLSGYDQSKFSNLKDFNHPKLTEFTDKSFSCDENIENLNDKEKSQAGTSDSFDQSETDRPCSAQNQNEDKDQFKKGLDLHPDARVDNRAEEKQSDNLSETSDNIYLPNNYPHRQLDQLADNLTTDRSIDRQNISPSSDSSDKNFIQAGLSRGNLIEPDKISGVLANTANQNAADPENQLAFGHNRSGSSSFSQDQELIEKLRNELSRLKQHLIKIEEDYTNELVEVQQREAKLEQQLIKTNAEFEKLTYRLNNTGPLVAIRAQAEQALDERDQALQRCSKLEDNVQRSQASLANLQMVIEHMQKEHDQQLQTANKLHEQRLVEERCRYSQLENELNRYQLKLKESNAALQAASRLSRQLHVKQETIDQLKSQLQKKEILVNQLYDEINQLNLSAEGKIDKQFIKNLVVGYFKADSTDKKQDVARLLARILDFNELEMRLAGIQLNTSVNLSGLDPHDLRRQNNSSSMLSSYAQDANESIAQQFVHFLEEESKVYKGLIAKKLATDLTKVVSPSSEPIKTTNLISMPAIESLTLPSSSGNLLAANIAATTNLGHSMLSQTVVNTNALGVSSATSQQEVRPMLVPNSGIVNAKLCKLSLNNVGKQSAMAECTNSSAPQPNTSQAPSPSVGSGDIVKPVVLNFSSSFNNFHNDKDN